MYRTMHGQEDLPERYLRDLLTKVGDACEGTADRVNELWNGMHSVGLTIRLMAVICADGMDKTTYGAEVEETIDNLHQAAKLLQEAERHLRMIHSINDNRE